MTTRLLFVGLLLGCSAITSAAADGPVPVAPAADSIPFLWILVALNALPLTLKIPVAIAHTILCLAVLRDRPPVPPRFAPKYVWALGTLVGGFAALCTYWLMHHARPLPDSAKPPEQH